MHNNCSTNHHRQSLRLFFALLVFVGTVLGGVVAYIYVSERNAYLAATKEQERHDIDLRHKAITESFDTVIDDLLFLVQHNELKDYLRNDTEIHRQRLAEEYKIIAGNRRVYDQIRFLDTSGQEIARVNYTPETDAHIVPSDQLQNKAQRYYFRESMTLLAGEIYISPLDLNMEKGTIETPHKPVVRFGIPIFDSNGKKRGVLLVNYLAQSMLDRLKHIVSEINAKRSLLNSDGYWLQGSNQSQEWGFMFADKQDLTFANQDLADWEIMQKSNHGQFITDHGLYTFQKVYPFQTYALDPNQQSSFRELANNRVKDYRWFLLSHVAQDVLDARFADMRLRFSLLGFIILAFAAFGSWHLALLITKRRDYQAQLVTMALYDPLTKLPNRKLFYDTLEARLAHCQRHNRKLSVLFIDLDGFKAVNDCHGHEAGDHLLVYVGQVLKQQARKSDFVARLSGDEFAIILPEVKDAEDGITVGNKIISALKDPISLTMCTSDCTAKIGASIGVAVYPDHMPDHTAPDHTANASVLVSIADEAMYQAKKAGKNQCLIGVANTDEPGS